MKANNLDELFKKKKTSNISFILRIVAVVFAMLIMFYLFFFLFNISDDNSYEIEQNGEKYGKSEFIKYQGEIYVPVPSGGLYTLTDVDVESFKALNSGSYIERIVGLDKNHVYFGNIPIPDLNPDTFYSIGNGYYSDGKNTYFCSASSERNTELSTLTEVVQMLTYSKSKSKKTQSYIYPYKKIETDKKLKPIENLYFFATDGEKVYYKGEVLENADLGTLENIDGYNEYFADKENVYYKSKLLPIKNSGKLRVVSSEQGDEFLYDEVNGYIFIEDYSFDREKAPYKVIGNEGNHLYNLIFINNEGIYYYDNQEKKQKRAGDNIFIGNVEEISPNIFSDDENIYYLYAYDIRSANRSSANKLISKNTEIYILGKKEDWQKVSDIQNGHAGAIWQKGNRYYYFDNFGIFQLIDNTVYQISDKETVEYLLNNNNNIGPNTIREFIENNKLIAINGEEKVKIKVKYDDSITISVKYFRIFLIFIGLVSIFYKSIKKLRNKNE
ncbi:DKNYY domain-containing protein [Fusobacterium polymorphum]|uniref:DKNYY domain-containing protein n=1 Tax=Fusobacterium nucleatum subsp. polymorphum TaxID=76857 RepID=UPI002B4BFE31|nr:DKNYY domain-containing protein [Fusobacterium polymorphum]WRL77327.1 DKNYY domain-containing protein [Fusobacterium polymorphum]